MPTDGKPKNGIVRQLFSYGGVSAMQTFVEFGVFAVLQLAGLPFRLANAVAVFCSGSFNYVMNRNVTFKSSSNYARSIAMFVAMYCWNLLFSNLMMAWIPRTARLAHHGGQDRHHGHAGGLGLPAVPLRHLQMTFAPDGFPAAITGKRTCYLTMDAHRETCG